MKNITRWIIGLIVLATWAIGIYYYPHLPTLVPSHWNAAGVIDGYVNQFWGAFLMPVIITILALLFMVLPIFDPKKENYQHFQKEYDQIVITLMLFFSVFYGFTLSWSLNSDRFEINRVLPIAMGLLFVILGTILPKIHQNWFVGIRTPWALENVTVWNDTQKFGGRAFQIAGILCLIGAFFHGLLIWFIVVPVLVAAVASVVYSYARFKQLETSQTNNS